jgi:monoterpene epsilon-lactone hydrolase
MKRCSTIPYALPQRQAQRVAVMLEIWPHMIHAWPMWNARLEDGRRALASAGRFMREQL